jgi:hypothetical protein
MASDGRLSSLVYNKTHTLSIVGHAEPGFVTAPSTPAAFGTPAPSMGGLLGGFGSPAGMLNMPVANIGKFHTASPATTSKKVVKERIEGGFLIKDPPTVIQELNIEPYIDNWTESIRWVSIYINSTLSDYTFVFVEVDTDEDVLVMFTYFGSGSLRKS